MNDKTVLAIDPGSSKCGMALVHRDRDGKLEVLWRAVVPQAETVVKVGEAQATRPFGFVIVGSGTRSRELVAAIKETHPGLGVLVVDERDTTMQARERYWEFHRRRGWRRLFPSTMLAPPEPVDDFVALILAERVLEHAS
ncbi:MAG: hypothetical protein KIS66_15915 [Fimbriimonadaceae bacterium]|nr:hypothetical protein [Fimbriimonadaceae bacterium]